MAILKSGDKIGFIAPSCSQQNKDLTKAIKYFESLGLNVVLAPNLNKEYRYMADTDINRAKAINQMYKDTSIKALFCIRGGAGSSRLLNYLDYDLIKNNPKPIIGLSDSTILQNALITKSKIKSFTGFLPLYDFKNKNIDSLVSSSLENALFDDKHHITSGSPFKKGEAKGVLIGGTLSSLLYLCGTPYFPNLKNKILLLEDTDEKTYKIDLMLNQIKQQKNFNQLRGIIFGKFSDCIIIDKEDGTIEDCIKDFTKDLNIPIITDFEYGHIPSRYVLPLGTQIKIKSSQNNCSISW